MTPSLQDLTTGAVDLDTRSIGRLITLFEDPRPEAAGKRALALSLLEKEGRSETGILLGITGTPGAGKSTLIGELAPRLIAKQIRARVAVLATDPASEISGGALLGDRTRVRFPPEEKRLFFRSQSSNRELGGLSPSAFQVCRLLARLFDYVLLETVGIGQSELEISRLADRIYLVLQPLGGDQVQFMKAGIMEIPDVFILNKCDQEDLALQSKLALQSSLSFSRPGRPEAVKLIAASALRGDGLDEIVLDMLGFAPTRGEGVAREREARFFFKWARDEYGRRGARRLLELCDETDGTRAALSFLENESFESAQIRFAELF